MRRIVSITAVVSLLASGLWGTIVTAQPSARAAENTGESTVEPPYHPQILWADSEEKSGEKAPNGTIAALTDDDTGKEPSEVTFWTTQWQGNKPSFPHVLAMDAQKNSGKICAIQYTARPSYKDVLGATNAPGRYQIYSFTTKPELPTDQAAWKQGLTNYHWEGGKIIGEGGLQADNAPQLMEISPSQDRYFAIVGLAAVAEEKFDMSAADIKMVPCVPNGDKPASGTGTAKLIQDIRVDQVPFTDNGAYVRFTPQRHTYSGIAYHFEKSVSVLVKRVGDAQISINGVPLAADQERLWVRLVNPQLNTLVVKATRGEIVETYALNITHTDSDYRGNVQLKASVQGHGRVTSGSSDAYLHDGLRSTIWAVEPITRTSQWQADSTGVTIDLAEPQWVSRLAVWGKPEFSGQNDWWDGASNVTIQYQDQAGNWQTLADRAMMRREVGGIFYWDWGKYVKTAHLRFFLNDLESVEVKSPNTFHKLSISEVEVWGLPPGSADPQVNTPLTGDTTKESFDPEKTDWGVNRAQALALQYGIIIPAWVPSNGYGRGVMNKKEQDLSGGAIPMFYDSPLFHSDMMAELKDSPWALAKAPAGGNSMKDYPEPKPFITEAMKPYAKNLVDIQYGDEGAWSKEEVDRFAKWFAFSKQTYPGAIVHSNQYDGDWKDNGRMEDYTKIAKPDLLSQDTYYYGGGNSIGSHNPGKEDNADLANILNNGMWKTQRKAALEGLDDSGKYPILYGQYIDYSMDINASESQKALIVNASLATGQKWFGLFRMEYLGADNGSLFSFDGAPSHNFFESARIFQNAKKFGKYLVALNSAYVATKQADGNQLLAQGYKMGSFADAQRAGMNQRFGVKDLSAVNVSKVHNQGGNGDVLLGYFDTLPGLKLNKLQEVFGNGITEARGVMVVNGLVGDTKLRSCGQLPRRDNGAYWETEQKISTTFVAPEPGWTLYRMNDEGKLAPVNLSVATDAVGTGDLSQGFTVDDALGGGQAALYVWVKGKITPENPDSSSTPNESKVPSDYPTQPPLKPGIPPGVTPPNPTPNPNPAPNPEPTLPADGQHNLLLHRFGGTDRVGTALAAWEQHPGENMVLVGDQAQIDALSATPLAKLLKSSVVYSPAHKLAAQVATAIKQHGVKRVYLAGGLGSISETVEQSIQALGVSTQRLGGADRYATALALANQVVQLKTGKSLVDKAGVPVVLASGVGFADASLAGALAAKQGGVVLLAKPDVNLRTGTLTADTRTWLAANAGKHIALGGVAADAAKRANLLATDFVVGKDRYETAANSFTTWFGKAETAVMARGDIPADLVVAGSFAAQEDTGLLLTKVQEVPVSVQQIFQGLKHLHVVGGQGVISNSLLSPFGTWQ